MSDFNSFVLDPTSFPWLQPFQQEWKALLEEFRSFKAFAPPWEQQFVQRVASPSSKTIKARSASRYEAFGFFYQGLFLDEYYRALAAKGMSLELPIAQDHCERLAALRNHYFPCLTALLAETKEERRIRNAYFGTFLPGLEIKLHTNRNPHQYRGYLGLQVPDGDVGMHIRDRVERWQEGKLMVLDHSQPHCPFNRTDENRVVLVIDFFRPNWSFSDAFRYEMQLRDQRLAENPRSLGVFGANDTVAEEVFHRYGLSQQLTWEKALQ